MSCVCTWVTCGKGLEKNVAINSSTTYGRCHGEKFPVWTQNPGSLSPLGKPSAGTCRKGKNQHLYPSILGFNMLVLGGVHLGLEKLTWYLSNVGINFNFDFSPQSGILSWRLWVYWSSWPGTLLVMCPVLGKGDFHLENRWLVQMCFQFQHFKVSNEKRAPRCLGFFWGLLPSYVGIIIIILSRWWFWIFFIFTPTWGDDPISLIFFRWVETTN